MASENSPEAWEAYAGSLSLENYDFIPTNQLLCPSQTWQLGQLRLLKQPVEDPKLSSGNEELDFEMGINEEP